MMGKYGMVHPESAGFSAFVSPTVRNPDVLIRKQLFFIHSLMDSANTRFLHLARHHVIVSCWQAANCAEAEARDKLSIE